MGFEADPSATGSSEGGRLRRSHNECWGGGEGIPPSPPFFLNVKAPIPQGALGRNFKRRMAVML